MYFKITKFFLFIVPLGIVIVTPSTLFPFIVGKYVFFRTTVDLALIFFLLGLFLNHQHQSAVISINQRLKSLFKNPLAIAVTAFAFIFILAGFFGVDPANSFWSNFERGEGGLQIIHLWLFFILSILLFKEEKDWQKLFISAIAGGVGMALYGFSAGMGWQGFIGGRFGDSGFRFSGSIGNPAYVAAVAIFMLFYITYLLSAKYKTRLLSFGAAVLYLLGASFLAVFWLAATRGAFLGLIAAIFAFSAYLIYSHKSWRRWLLVGILFVSLIVGSGIYFKDTAFVKSIPGSRLFDISFSATTFQHRTYMWKMAWDGFKERPLLGWGPENYLKIFDRHFNIKYFKPSEGFGAWFDRAHSVYFDYLAETGILGLLSYLAIFAAFYILLIRNSKFKALNSKQIQNPKLQIQNPSNSFESALLFSLPVAYLVQGLALFDVLPIYINLFLFLAFAAYKFNLKSQILNLKSTSQI